MIKGIPASPGIVIGKAFLFDTEDLAITKRKITSGQIAEEIARFENALIETRAQILKIQEKISKEVDTKHAEIFSAHLLVLEDRTLIEDVITSLKKQKIAVEYIFLEVLKKYTKAFSHIEDEYLKERVADIEDVGKRVLRNLLGQKKKTLKDLKEQVIVVAYDLSPSDTASMHRKSVLGFITDIGGRTSHTAIMAKSLEIPAVVGLETATRQIKHRDTLIVDGTKGVVIINPDKKTLGKYQQERERFEAVEKELVGLKDLPAETKDGRKIELSANIELPEEVLSVVAHGAAGIGLYRTEFFYMDKTKLPTEEEHFKAYKKVAEHIAPNPVIIRTMDLGGDKFVSHLDTPYEMNPFLGWRAIRFSLARPEIFKVQLRAILRASAYGNLKIMYPMISGIRELEKANEILEEVKAELKKRRAKFNKDIEVGAMIEIPSAALTCDLLAKEVNFFSIGTNDLIQYSLAVDRVNEKIAYLYESAHPAVLRLIKNVIEVGHKNDIWVGMCGEMAGEPHLALILLGLGLDEFSSSPLLLPEIKRVIRAISYKEAKRIAVEALKFESGKEIEEFAMRELKKIAPELGR